MHNRKTTFYTALIAIFAALLAVPSTFFVDSFNDYVSFLTRWSSGLTRPSKIDLTAPPAHTARYRPRQKPRLKLVEIKYHGRAASVRLAADFNRWNPAHAPFDKVTPDLWKITVPLPPGRYHYQLEVDGRFRTDPGVPAVEEVNGRDASILEVR